MSYESRKQQMEELVCLPKTLKFVLWMLEITDEF